MELLNLLRKIDMNDKFNTGLVNESSEKYRNGEKLDSKSKNPLSISKFQVQSFDQLKVGNKSLGFLCCYRTNKIPFSHFQATLLSTFGELLGIIVENHRLRIEAQELATLEERQRLAREIHDAISQSVYSLSLFARSAKDAFAEDEYQKLSENLNDIETTSLKAMREMRLLLYQLREASQERDIETALNTRFSQVEHRLGIQAEMSIDPHLHLDPNIQHQIWRILIESLNNTVKHAMASHVAVKLMCSDNFLLLSIQDDGIGFNTKEHSAGMGLNNIATRAELLNAKLDISSHPGHGTRIVLEIPLNCVETTQGD